MKPETIALFFPTTGLFYKKETGGFNAATIEEATPVPNDSVTIAFIKAHYLHPEKIEVREFPTTAPVFTADDLPKLAEALAALPSPDNAHLNPHINGSIRARKTYHKGSSRSYRFGDYRIEVTVSRNSRKQGCGFRKVTTCTNFDLINHTKGEHSYINSGGLKAALAKITKIEMTRHGL
jgi:type IV secretory pathway ATPase VirB11/archaellum biosynthesis ATPase